MEKEKRKYPGCLHGHSDFSNLRLRDCTNKVDDYIWTAAKMGYNGVALTDHDSLSGHIKALKTYEEVKKEYPNFKFLLGNEIYLCRNGLNNETFESGVDKYYHFLLIALDVEGHKQLRELSTRAWERSYMARGMRRVPTYYQDLIDIVGENKGHLAATSACLGSYPGSKLLEFKETRNPQVYNDVESWVQLINNVFGQGYFFLEMQPSKSEEQVFVNKELIKLSYKYDIPTIINSDAHYLRPENRDTHRAFLKSQNGEREVDAFYATTYLMTTEEIYDFLSESIGEDEIERAFEGNQKVIDMAQDYSLEKSLKIPKLEWRDFSHITDKQIKDYEKEIPEFKNFKKSKDVADRTIIRAIVDALERKEDLQNKRAMEEINLNLQMIRESSKVNKASWSSYLLNLQKIVDYCWEAGTLIGASRGSGGGFLLLYVLEIIQINLLQEKTPMKPWRFLNPERVSVLDVDIDISAAKRQQVLNKFHEAYGEDRVCNVVTFRTEQSKSALKTASRGLGIDIDEANYLSSLIPSDRGMLRSLKECMYGDEEKGWKPIKQFHAEMTYNYPELWKVAVEIEGLISGSGLHAGGVVFVDEPFTETTALMRGPDGTLCTQFELHDLERCSLIKYDILSIEALDRIQMAIELLSEYGYIEREKTLKETYEKVIGVYNLERQAPEMWKMVHNHEVGSLFQLTAQTGIDGIDALKPESLEDLSILNSSIRLMAQERGGEMPTDKVARFKHDLMAWSDEMNNYGLTEEEQESLKPILETTYGVCLTQEQFMSIVQLPIAGGFSLQWADRARKSVAKKIPKEFEALEQEYYEGCKEKGVSPSMSRYVWSVLVKPQAGYSFNASHTTSYSILALQELNLAFRYPIIFWNCACLIVDSGGTPEDLYIDKEYLLEETETGTTDYGKIAAAIGKMKSTGVEIISPSINKSGFTFLPDVDNNKILYGLNGLTRVNDKLIKEIILNRPYSSIDDFNSKVKTNVLQMLSLIKSGSFDEFDDREIIMKNFIISKSDVKKRVTLQNMKMLIDFDLIPEEYDFQKKVWNFDKYIKKNKIGTNFFGVDENSYRFIEENYGIDNLLLPNGDGFKIPKVEWNKEYQKNMDIIRPYVRENAEELLSQINNRLIGDTWEKYATGSISKWEMDSISCYIHAHELSKVDHRIQGWANYFELSEEPEVEKVIFIKGKPVPILKIQRIAGTVLDRNTNKRIVTLLTTEGVVTVKFFGGLFEQYDKQISKKLPNGKKQIVEKSIFTRGNKIIVCGIRRGQVFIAKKYKKTPYHTVEQIIEIDKQNKPVIKKERYSE